ncbi:hypothetical protein FNV43_RR07751 [Rhamnella rubrinervis]|uniref:Cysteine-rich receptor-like protein kinase 25 n=1 Tax=Rhamnella rubrinervis TaxID=2594499 RepID=A0A8K0MNA5_9ROSA|nr:hypothetical protein FNV43_RR07751 [Rhamnella rubrinervis]
MPCFNVFKAAPLLISMLTHLISFAAEAIPTYIGHSCTNTSTFIPNSPYHSNLETVFSSLSTDANRETDFHFSSCKAGDNGTSNIVYGIYLCRGDLSSDICRDCVSFSTKDAGKRCPLEQEAVLWYEECMLRYSNRSLASTVAERPRFALLNTANITDEEKFKSKQKIEETMNGFASEAARGATKFLTQETNFSEFQTIYSMAQCTDDLSSQDCTTCLLDAIVDLTSCCDGKTGGRVLFPSCTVRYELYPFYNLTSPTQFISPSTPQTPPPLELAPPVTRPKGKSRLSPLTISGIVIAVTAVSLALLAAGYCIMRHGRAANKSKNISRENGENQIATVESLQFNLATIEIATNKFSEGYKLGEGGFGEVFKGILPNGQEIAVKRLSKSSGQGENEFKNEVVLVAKLQHRNLVRLLGFCLDAGEKLLVYEFVPNKSLDYFLFDPQKQGELDWSKRRKIIGGIARGILYLHEDSRLRVIHRDLKASNILLDAELNPKVSDFGMARMFGIDQTEGNTARIVGTYLLIHAWNLWNEGKVMELMDPSLKQSCAANEFMRHVHIGLLCVQEDAYCRPTMSSVILMLTSETISLSKPQRPAFSVGRNIPHQHQLRPDSSISDNGLTISAFVPR